MPPLLLASAGRSIGASAHPSAKLVNNATLKVHPGGSHGLADTQKDQLTADLVAFLRA